jgi:hypothetical protein
MESGVIVAIICDRETAIYPPIYLIKMIQVIGPLLELDFVALIENSTKISKARWGGTASMRSLTKPTVLKMRISRL